MKKICKYLLEEIQLIDNRIVPCGSRFWDGYNTADKFFIKPDASLKEIDFDYYFQKRHEYIEMYQRGETPEFCEDCVIYQPISSEADISQQKNIKKIHINHKTICSCRCIYCCLADNGDLKKFEEINKQVTYDIKPILTNIADRGLLDENTEICIFGGECTEYPDDLDFIINVGLQNKCTFLIATNGIIYNENIANLLRTADIQLRFSLDSGSKETFEKIKRVKAYDRVIKNIEKYSEAARNNPKAKIQMKYIICPDINDNIEEINKFFEIIKKNNADSSILSINRFWLFDNKNNPTPEGTKRLIKYYFDKNTYPDISKSTDSDELWDWWVEKVLKEEDKVSFKERMLKLFKR